MNNQQAKETLQTICAYHNHNLTYSEAKEALQTLLDEDADDFTFDLDGNEYRIIADSAIWDIYVEEIRRVVEDCYDLKLDQVPDL